MANELETQIDDLLKHQQIKTHTDYVSWVRRWKKLHNEVVSRIKFFKHEARNTGVSLSEAYHLLKYAQEFPEEKERALKAEQQGELLMFTSVLAQGNLQKYLHLHKKMVTPMYKERVDQKVHLKDGKYPWDENMKGHNSRNHQVMSG